MYSIISMLVWLAVNYQCVNANDYIATGSCSSSFKAINNGCYQVFNTTMRTWTDANTACAGISAHLVSFETKAETVALTFYLKGFGHTLNYWTDRVSNGTAAPTWLWSNYEYEYFGTLKQNLSGQTYSYLKTNSSNDYELHDNDGSLTLAYICEEKVTCQTADDVCMNNSTCYVNAGRVLCICLPGYSGILCEIPLDYCESSPCQHGGTCIQGINSYNCSCTEYYDGTHCENELNYQHEAGRKAALIVSACLVGLVILLLCLMDLPWEKLKNTYDETKSKKAEKAQVAQSAQSLPPVKKKLSTQSVEEKQKAQIKQSNDLLVAEEEMLKRFKSALVNTRRSPRISQTPEPVLPQNTFVN